MIASWYLKRPEKAISKSNKFILTRSMDALFRTDMFNYFRTKDEATDMVTAFRIHMEDVVRADKPIKNNDQSIKKE